MKARKVVDGFADTVAVILVASVFALTPVALIAVLVRVIAWAVTGW